MRCFIAIELPDELKNKLYDLQEKLFFEKITKVNKNIFHLTVLFLGELNKNQVEILSNCLDKIKMNKFNVSLIGVDSFKRNSQNGTVYVKISLGDIEFNELYLKVKRTVEDCIDNIKIENTQKPHVSILRVKDNKEIFKVLKNYSDYLIGSFEVKQFILKKSILTKEGPIYEDIEKFELEG